MLSNSFCVLLNILIVIVVCFQAWPPGIECQICHMTFSDQSTISAHYDTVHAPDRVLISPNTNVRCVTKSLTHLPRICGHIRRSRIALVSRFQRRRLRVSSVTTQYANRNVHCSGMSRRCMKARILYRVFTK